jgi:hypothetical protein
MAGARRFPRNSENFFVQGEGVGSTMETEESKHAELLFSRRRNSGLTRVQAYVRPILAWGRGRVGRVRVEVV